MSSGLYPLITVAAPSVQNTWEMSAPICGERQGGTEAGQGRAGRWGSRGGRVTGAAWRGGGEGKLGPGGQLNASPP